MTITEGSTLSGRYRLEKRIGEGGTSQVFRAFDEDRQAAVAVKLLRAHLASDPNFVRRFREEAEALEALDHPSIVRLYAFEETAEGVFIVLDYVPGATLRERLAAKRGAFPLTEATRILRDLAGALHYAHRKGILHQDLKPGNIIMEADGRAVLTDFGIARALGSAGAVTVTMGTPAYMSPEQIQGEAPGVGSDIYSLGIVLYELVTGRRPFTGEEAGLHEANTTDRLHEAHLWLTPPDPRVFNPQVPPQAGAVLLRALGKRPRDRWPDVLSFRLAWEAAVSGETPAAIEANEEMVITPKAVAPRPTHKPTRWLTVLGIGLLIVLGAGGAVIAMLQQGGAASSAANIAGVAPTSAPASVPNVPQPTQKGGITTAQPLAQVLPTHAPAVSVTPKATTAPAGGEPTVIPTFTPEAPPSPTVAPSSTPTLARPTAPPTRAPTRAAGGVTLAVPPAGATLSGVTLFEWQPAPGFALGPGEGYELVFWPPGQDGFTAGRSPVGASTQTATTVDLNQLTAITGLPAGPLMWGVRLWGGNGAMRMLSEGRAFTYAPTGSDGGGGGEQPPKPDF